MIIFLQQMLKEHLDMCREEDDSTNIMEYTNLANYDSEDDEDEDEDEDLDPDDPLKLNGGMRYLYL